MNMKICMHKTPPVVRGVAEDFLEYIFAILPDAMPYSPCDAIVPNLWHAYGYQLTTINKDALRSSNETTCLLQRQSYEN